jgi:hypothetical protein
MRGISGRRSLDEKARVKWLRSLFTLGVPAAWSILLCSSSTGPVYLLPSFNFQGVHGSLWLLLPAHWIMQLQIQLQAISNF